MVWVDTQGRGEDSLVEPRSCMDTAAVGCKHHFQLQGRLMVVPELGLPIHNSREEEQR